MRILFLLGMLCVLGLILRARWQRWQRRRRGEPEPVQRGPRTVTLVVIAIVLVYGLLIGYRLVAGNWHIMH